MVYQYAIDCGCAYIKSQAIVSVGYVTGLDVDNVSLAVLAYRSAECNSYNKIFFAQGASHLFEYGQGSDHAPLVMFIS